MTAVILKSARVQTVLVNGLLPPPPPVFYSEEITIEVLDEIDIVLDEIDIVLCSED